MLGARGVVERWSCAYPVCLGSETVTVVHNLYGKSILTAVDHTTVPPIDLPPIR